MDEMEEDEDALHDRLLREWNFRHEMAQYYSTALLRLMPSDRDAERRRHELSARLANAMLVLTQVTDQLHTYERRHGLTMLAP